MNALAQEKADGEEKDVMDFGGEDGERESKEKRGAGGTEEKDAEFKRASFSSSSFTLNFQCGVCTYAESPLKRRLKTTVHCCGGHTQQEIVVVSVNNKH